MAATFIFKLGTLDLSSFVRVNPDDNMDPYGQPWLQPAFTETPFADGQPLISTTVSNREQMWPLYLKESTRLKDDLHKLIQSIQVAAGQKPLLVEWRDDGATKSTFYDVVFLRFEPDFNFRRSQHGYGAGVLHIWVSGYAHSGTLRITGTAAGTGVFLSVPVASLGGDSPALLDSTITAGANLPSLGRIVGLAPISHPSYIALIPAASLTSPQPGASLFGASGAQGSQCLAMPVSPTGGASGVACKVPLANPTIMGGDNRVLAVVRSGITGGIGVLARDPYGNTMGGTAIASSTDWALIDLGVCRLPTVGFPTRPEISLQAGGIWASGAAGPAVFSSPAFQLNEVICLPDKNLTLALESNGGGTAISQDGFPGNIVPLPGNADALGHTWAPAFNHAHAGDLADGAFATGRGLIEYNHRLWPGRQRATVALIDADHLADVASDSMRITAKTLFSAPALGMEEIRLFKDVKPSQFVQARLAASGFLALEAATGGAAGNRLASVAIATISANLEYRLGLQVQGPQAFVTLSRDDGGPVFAPGSAAAASIGVASNAAVAGRGVPAVAMVVASTVAPEAGPAESRVSSWEVTSIPSSNLLAYDSYRFDGPDADAYRTSSAGVFAGQKLTAGQRGAFPKAAPSTSSIAIICAPFDQGAANDQVSAVVSARERFFYAR